MTTNITVTVRFLMSNRIREQLLECARVLEGTEGVITVDAAQEVTIDRDRLDIGSKEHLRSSIPHWRETTTIMPIK